MSQRLRLGRRDLFSRTGTPVLAVLVGVLATTLLADWVERALDLTVGQLAWSWLKNHLPKLSGAPFVAPKYFDLYMVGQLLCGEAVMAVLAGVAVGLLARGRWLACVLLYLAGHCGGRYAYLIGRAAVGQLHSPAELVNPRASVFLLVSGHGPVTVTPIAIASAWLASRPWKRRRAARLTAGLCVTCGYDLRGNVSGRCPECGTPSRQHADAE